MESLALSQSPFHEGGRQAGHTLFTVSMSHMRLREDRWVVPLRSHRQPVAEWGPGVFGDTTWNIFQGPGCLAEPKGGECSLARQRVSGSRAASPPSLCVWSQTAPQPWSLVSVAPASFFSLRVALPVPPCLRTDRAASRTLHFQVTGPSLHRLVPLCPGHGSLVPRTENPIGKDVHLWSSELWLEPRCNNTDEKDDRNYDDSDDSLHILGPYWVLL